MNRQLTLLTLLAFGWVNAHAASLSTNAVSTNAVSTNRVLVIDPSSMAIAAGKATLTIGMLQRANGIYSGDYKIDVSPYFFKNENGKLAIVVSDESLKKVSQGKVATIVGTATTDGKGGPSRHIDATATPANVDHGKLKLWFMAGDRKMIFEPAYHFADRANVTSETNLTFNLKGRIPVSHREALEASLKHP